MTRPPADAAAFKVALVSVARHVERGELGSALATLALWFGELRRATVTTPEEDVRLARCFAAALVLADELSELEEMAAAAHARRDAQGPQVPS